MNFFKKDINFKVVNLGNKINFFILSFLFSFISIYSYCQTNYTFCYGPVSITMIGGGNAEMVRYNSSGSIVSRETGTFDLYGAGGRTEVLKVQFQGKEYRYDLIRDGYGKPSIIIDIQGRKYNICKSTSVESGQSGSISNFQRESFNSKDPKQYLTDFIIVDKFAITKQDINRVQGSWYDAMIVCKDLGEGWHLPTYNELIAIYNSKENSNALFSDGKYWSSTECIIKEGQGNFAQNFEGAWVVDFKRGSYREKFVVGKLGGRPLENLNYVRAVKELTKYQIDEFNKTNKLPVYKNAPKPQVLIGDSYQGGIVFYILKNGDPGYDPYEQHGLIAATSDQSSGITWYWEDKPIQLCKDYRGGGFTDWYLPSIKELKIIYENISKLGYDTFQNKSYWSIDKFVRGGHSILWFDSGGRELDPDKNPSNAVHAIRAF